MQKNLLPSTPRRRFFQLAAASAALAGFGFAAHAQGRHGHGAMDPAKLEERLDRMLKHLYVEVDATDAQKQKLDPIVKQAANDLRPLRRQRVEARRRGAELLSAEKIDRAAIESARAEGSRAAEASSKRFTQALTDVAEVLTPPQRKKLAARLAHRGRHGRGGMFG